jgi:hypothetical protein
LPNCRQIRKICTGRYVSATIWRTRSLEEERTLSQALTLQYDQEIFILEPSEQAKAAIGKRVTVVDYPDGRLSIRYKGVELAYRTFDKLRQVDQGAVDDNKAAGPTIGDDP